MTTNHFLGGCPHLRKEKKNQKQTNNKKNTQKIKNKKRRQDLEGGSGNSGPQSGEWYEEGAPRPPLVLYARNF